MAALLYVLAAMVALAGVGMALWGALRERDEARRWLWGLAGAGNVLLAVLLFALVSATRARLP
ncbi:drug/metabolite transporter superfamily protein YnfA [Deinobacterium chartae]|uniref:Drug/metabolite transporter superfamily protein YnfA n=1 Tax=Deinobacterium chartae TaxID=521158 RepID=A0A841HZM0_9DEIO|nr:hypothetical protein [Deinobacterium chartae]MBB6097649.1 drug/metabolite transporter superfamily protein YnfA [Deinobacterium chartae]